VTIGEVLLAVACIAFGVALIARPETFARMYKYRPPSEQSVRVSTAVNVVLSPLFLALGVVAFGVKGL
jgi:hypothetical protein